MQSCIVHIMRNSTTVYCAISREWERVGGHRRRVELQTCQNRCSLSLTAAAASAAVEKVTKPKPRDWPRSRSMITTASCAMRGLIQLQVASGSNSKHRLGNASRCCRGFANKVRVNQGFEVSKAALNGDALDLPRQRRTPKTVF